MKKRVLAAWLSAIGLASAAFAADWLIAPGRWETTGEVQYGPQRPRGMPAVNKYSNVDCISEKWALSAKAPIPLPDESCKISNQRNEGRRVSFTVQCDDTVLDYVIDTRPDAYSGTAVSRGKDPATHFTVKFDSKRTGPRCSAKEIAEDGGE
jgi:opacity protein-like surface antigen